MKKQNFTSLFIIGLLALANGLMANETLLLINKKFEDLAHHFKCPIISTPQAQKAITKGHVTLIDIRTKKERQISILPNAISQDEFVNNIAKYKNKILIAYCTIGYRSGAFAEKYRVYKIFNLKGGVLAWSHYNGKFVKNGQETKRVHTYSIEWNLLNKNYQAISK
jgi:rhodanese-related sulfurtransferase